MNFTELIGHYCIRGARLNVHRPPQTVRCGHCGQGGEQEHKLHFTHENAVKVGINLNDPKCPNCNEPMEHSGPTHHAELFIELCLDGRVHEPEELRTKFFSNEITREEFDSAIKKFTERERLGYFDQRVHVMAIKLDHQEVDTFEANPAKAIEALLPKIKARLELDAQFQIQHRHKTTRHDVTHHFKALLKASPQKPDDE